MTSPALPHRGVLARMGRALSRLARATGGASAIEFAMVAPVFFVLLFGIIETGVLYLAQADLQYAVNNAARKVRTGQVQSGNVTQQAFRDAICSDISAVLSCNGNLSVDVVSYPTFTPANYQSPLNADGTLSSNLNHYQPGTSGQVVLLRVVYTWQVATPLLTPFLVNMAGNFHLLSATAAFRNEPF